MNEGRLLDWVDAVCGGARETAPPAKQELSHSDKKTISVMSGLAESFYKELL